MEIEYVYDNLFNNLFPSKILNFFLQYRESLEQKGIILNDSKDAYFKINFDFEKINQTSLAIKHNITGISLIENEMILLRGNEIVYVDEIFVNTMRLKNIFICKNLLIEIFKIIGFNMHTEKINYYIDELTKEEETTFENIIKDLESDQTNKYDSFKECFDFLKPYIKLIKTVAETEKTAFNKFEEIKNNFLNNVLSKEETIKNINSLNENIKLVNFFKNNSTKKFFEKMIVFEEILFSEVFNLVPENTTIDSKIKFLKDNYILFAIKIYHSLIGLTGLHVDKKIKNFIDTKL